VNVEKAQRAARAAKHAPIEPPNVGQRTAYAVTDPRWPNGAPNIYLVTRGRAW